MAEGHSSAGAPPMASGSASSSPLKLTLRELNIHAELSVEEFKNELRDGNVLVLIGGKGHIVHYDKLIATGSTKFTSRNGGLFDVEVQRKLRVRKGYAKQPPRSCEYILDLTPPTDGDDAVELVEKLSCSDGYVFFCH